MKIEEYVLSEKTIDLEEVDLDELTEWEKESILRVSRFACRQ